MDILVSIITSSVVVGILKFLFEEKYKQKIALLSKDVDFLKANEAKDFDYANQAIRNIWNELLAFDDFIRYDLPKNVESGNFNNSKIREFLLNIKKETISLPNELYDLTENCLDDILINGMDTMNKFVYDFNLFKKGKLLEDEVLENTNKNLNNFQEKFNESLILLRKEYREYITKHSTKNDL